MAKNNTASSQQYQISVSPSPIGNEVKNQNQIQTQNQGEEQQIQVANQEEEATQEGSQNRSQTALKNMSTVAQKVQELLETKTQGGIGEQVREVAQAQNEAQDQIEEQFDKLESKGKLMKFLFGTDFGAVKNLEQLMEQNRLRIETLNQLHTQLTNQADATLIQETIQALTEQNTALEEMVQLEEQSFSLFGWLIKLFNK